MLVPTIQIKWMPMLFQKVGNVRETGKTLKKKLNSERLLWNQTTFDPKWRAYWLFVGHTRSYSVHIIFVHAIFGKNFTQFFLLCFVLFYSSIYNWPLGLIDGQNAKFTQLPATIFCRHLWFLP